MNKAAESLVSAQPKAPDKSGKLFNWISQDPEDVAFTVVVEGFVMNNPYEQVGTSRSGKPKWVNQKEMEELVGAFVRSNFTHHDQLSVITGTACFKRLERRLMLWNRADAQERVQTGVGGRQQTEFDRCMNTLYDAKQTQLALKGKTKNDSEVEREA